MSEWYINRLAQTWVERGSIISAHKMVEQGLDYFVDMLFGLNNQLIPDMRWKHYVALRLENKPRDFEGLLSEILLIDSVNEKSLTARRKAFSRMWTEMKTQVEEEFHKSYEQLANEV